MMGLIRLCFYQFLCLIYCILTKWSSLTSDFPLQPLIGVGCILALWRAQWLCGFVSNYFDRLFPKLDPFSTQQRGSSVGNVYG